METVKQYWSEIDEFFESITPTVEPVKKVQEKIPFPIRYILMALVTILFLVFYFCTRKCCFFKFCSFFCGLISCMVSFAKEKNEEKKWVGFWLLFAFGEMLPACLNANAYFSIIKCLTLIYFALYNDCSIIIVALKVCYETVVKYFELYKQQLCSKEEKDKQN